MRTVKAKLSGLASVRFRSRRRALWTQLLVGSFFLTTQYWTVVSAWGISSWFHRQSRPHNLPLADKEYDLIIIGAGASGLFASGASTMLGSKTLLVDLVVGNATDNNGEAITSNIGGDCTNSACVPSKAVRSVARMAAASRRSKYESNLEFSQLARQHAMDTVLTVRQRGSPGAMVERNP